MSTKFVNEIHSFSKLWKGGFKTGYREKRNQKGIEEYIKQNMTGKCCLEIGCGGGQWSKYIYNLNIFDKIYCIDVLSEEHNNFWNYIGNEKKDKIEYIQVKDFSLDCIPINCLNYVFSYDVFCHISYSGQEEYLKKLYNKCKVDCKLFIMYADPTKFISNEPENIDFIVRQKGRCFLNLPNLNKKKKYNINNIIEIGGATEIIKNSINECDGYPDEGRWYWVGIDNFEKLCIINNYKILDKDLNIDKTNPITLFEKI